MSTFELQKHVEYIKSLDKKTDIDSLVMEHLRMSGEYWGLTALDMMHSLVGMDGEEIAAWILSCQHDCGGFGGNVGHDPHILYTLNAKEDGSFAGDEWGQIDTRFSYAAVNCLSILSRLDAIDVQKATYFLVLCKNFDGGFGCTPGGESHTGQIFCCVAALAIMGALHHVDKDLLGWWLCERQVKQGGLNGRPEKFPDVCYSWWVLASLVIIDRANWIDKEKLKGFVLSCQDQERGGISDAPDDAVDIFHTFFGVAGLSLLEHPDIRPIDAAYAFPIHVVDRIFYGQRH